MRNCRQSLDKSKTNSEGNKDPFGINVDLFRCIKMSLRLF